MKLHYGRDGRDSSGNMREKKKQRRMKRSRKLPNKVQRWFKAFKKGFRGRWLNKLVRSSAGAARRVGFRRLEVYPLNVVPL